MNFQQSPPPNKMNPQVDTTINKIGKGVAKIVQFADDKKTLPDGSKIIYAENETKIVLYHKKGAEKGTTYIYERTSGKIMINNRQGDNDDKREMIRLGTYLLSNSKDSELITITVKKN